MVGTDSEENRVLCLYVALLWIWCCTLGAHAVNVIIEM